MPLRKYLMKSYQIWEMGVTDFEVTRKHRVSSHRKVWGTETMKKQLSEEFPESELWNCTLKEPREDPTGQVNLNAHLKTGWVKSTKDKQNGEDQQSRWPVTLPSHLFLITKKRRGLSHCLCSFLSPLLRASMPRPVPPHPLSVGPKGFVWGPTQACAAFQSGLVLMLIFTVMEFLLAAYSFVFWWKQVYSNKPGVSTLISLGHLLCPHSELQWCRLKGSDGKWL